MEVFKIKKKEQVTDFRFKKLNVAAYVRVSTEKESQVNSYESMKKYYRDKIEKNNNWNLVKIYSDYGISGVSRFKRLAFNEMMDDAIEGKIDLILTKSVSRFARNSVDALSSIRLLKEKNIGVYFEEENIYTLNLESELLVSIMSSVAQKESEETSKKILYGLKMLHENGVATIYNPSLGYDHDKENKTLIVNKKEARIVKMIFKMYLEGFTMMEIARHLNEKKFRTKYNNPFSSHAVRKILKNIVYVGSILNGRYYIKERGQKPIKNRGERPIYIIKNHHDPIISEEDFKKVQLLMGFKKNSFLTSEIVMKEYKPIDTDLIGFFRCGFCGATLIKKSTGSKKGNNIYYKCETGQYFNSIRAHCESSMRIKDEVIQTAFLEGIKRLKKLDFNSLGTNVVKVDNYNKLEKEKDSIINKLSDYAERYMEGTLNLYDYNQAKKQYEERLIIINKDLELMEINNQKIDTIKSIEKEVKEANDLLEFDLDFFKRFLKYVIIGGRVGNKKDGRLIRFVYRTDKINRIKPTKEEVIDNAIDSGYSKLKLLIRFKCPIKFQAYEYNPKTGKKERKDIESVNVRFEYEKEDEEDENDER